MSKAVRRKNIVSTLYSTAAIPWEHEHPFPIPKKDPTPSIFPKKDPTPSIFPKKDIPKIPTDDEILTNVINQLSNMLLRLNRYNYDNPKTWPFGIIETRTHWGQRKEGVDDGPAYITKHNNFQNYLTKLEFNNYNWNYHAIIEQENNKTIPYQRFLNIDDTYRSSGNTIKEIDILRKPIDGIESNHYLENINHVLYDCNILSQNENMLTLNLLGDHSSGIGTVLSSLVYDPDAVTIWIDAHADINIPSTSPTGNCHGMPLAFATGLMNDYIKEDHCWDWVSNIPKLKFENLIYIGIRDIDKGEQDIIDKYGITVLKPNQIYRLAEIIRDRNVHISFDVDSLDPLYFECTGTPVKNGLCPDDVMNIINLSAMYGNLFKMDITEFNPKIKPEYNESCYRIIKEYAINPFFDIY